jgi:hypothetical protein
VGGNIEAALGNVFGIHLGDFRPGRLRFSGDIGIATIGVGDYPVEMIFGMGSETFDQGAALNSFRFTVSVNHGF